MVGPTCKTLFSNLPPLSSSRTGPSGAAAHAFSNLPPPPSLIITHGHKWSGDARAGMGAGAGCRPQSLVAARTTAHAARGGGPAGAGVGGRRAQLQSTVSPPRADEEEEEPAVAVVAHRIRTKQTIFLSRLIV